MILKKLSEERPECVFKGGTSLSKCHHVLDRFSEDIDITFSNKLTQGRLISGVKMEISLASVSFPTVELPVDSYVYQFLAKENMDVVEAFDLYPFKMNVQGIDRTLVDKVFAICDYYLQGKTRRYSRHIYDIYMLLPKVEQNQELRELVRQVRELRAEMSICPSAVQGVDIPQLLKEIIDKEVYKADYAEITTYFQKHPVEYERAIEAVRELADSGMF